MSRIHRSHVPPRVRAVRVAVALLATGALSALAVPLASAAVGATPTITAPSSPYHAVVDAHGHAAPVTVRASGYVPGELVDAMLCDATPARKGRFLLSLDCDAGTAPAPVLADAKGVATFVASDRNHGFTPVYGTSPQGLFHCLAKGDVPPRDVSPTSITCAIRVATNNFNRTDDEAYVDVVFEHAGHSGSSAVPWWIAAVIAVVVLGVVAVAILMRRPRSATSR